MSAPLFGGDSTQQIPPALKSFRRWWDLDGVPHLKKGSKSYARRCAEQRAFVAKWDEQFELLVQMSAGPRFVARCLAAAYAYEDQKGRYWTPLGRWAALSRWVRKEYADKNPPDESGSLEQASDEVGPEIPDGAEPLDPWKKVRVGRDGVSISLAIRKDGGYRTANGHVYEWFRGEPKRIWNGDLPGRQPERDLFLEELRRKSDGTTQRTTPAGRDAGAEPAEPSGGGAGKGSGGVSAAQRKYNSRLWHQAAGRRRQG